MTTRGLTMTTPTSQQDELDRWLTDLAYRGHSHASDVFKNGNQIDEAIKRDVQKTRNYIDHTVAERVLAIIGEDDEEPYDEGSRFWQKIRNRNELRAELRAAVQTQGEQKDE